MQLWIAVIGVGGVVVGAVLTFVFTALTQRWEHARAERATALRERKAAYQALNRLAAEVVAAVGRRADFPDLVAKFTGLAIELAFLAPARERLATESISRCARIVELLERNTPDSPLVAEAVTAFETTFAEFRDSMRRDLGITD